jgi:hypothetical protein
MGWREYPDSVAVESRDVVLRLRWTWLSALVFLVGCAPNIPPPSHTISLNISLPIHPGTATHLGLLVGSLAAQDGCLFVRGSDGTLVGIAWPAGTRWDARDNSIVVNGIRASLGETVRIVGGLYDISVETINRQLWLRPPRPECLGDEFWMAGGLSTDKTVSTRA